MKLPCTKLTEDWIFSGPYAVQKWF